MRKLFLTSYFSGVYVGADKKSLGKLGLVIDELEISTAPYDEIVNKISNADYIFVEGGNTFFLLKELKRTRTDKLIIEHINKGKLYIGASAGSIIVSKNIEYAKYMDNPSIAKDLNGDFSALGVVDFYIVPQHFTNFPFKKAGEKIVGEYSEKLDLYPISNNQVVVVDGERVEVKEDIK